MDLKKIIAYSTCSQMGYLVFCAGLSKFDVSFFHLINHAFFKCLLFISAGVLIHSFFNEQDIRKYGGLIKLFPFIWIILIISSLSLMGFPFLSGFYSKEKIVEYSFYIYNSHNLIAFWFSNLSAFLTAVYSIRLLTFSFLTLPNNFKKHYEILHTEFPNIINIVLFILGLGAVFSGFVLNDLIIGFSTDIFNYTSNMLNIYSLNIHLGNFHLNFLTFKYTIFGILLYSYIYLYRSYINNLFYYSYVGGIRVPINNGLYQLRNNLFDDSDLKLFYLMFSKKWFINIIYNSYLTKFIFYIGYHVSFKLLDKGYLEFFSFFFFIQNLNKLFQFLYLKLYKFSYFEEILFLIVLTIFLYFYLFISILVYSTEHVSIYNFNGSILDLFLVFFLLAVPKKRKSVKSFFFSCKKANLTNKFFFFKFKKC